MGHSISVLLEQDPASQLEKGRWPTPGWGRVASQSVEEFKYLGVLFRSCRKIKWEIDRWTGASSAVMRMLKHSVVVKRELSQKAKLSILSVILFSNSHLWSGTLDNDPKNEITNTSSQN